MAKTVRLTKPFYPHAVELEYFRALNKMYRLWFNELFDQAVNTYPNVVYDAADIRTDDINSDFIQKWTIRTNLFTSTLKALAGKVNKIVFRNLTRQVKKVTGIDLFEGDPFFQKTVNDWTKINTGLITNMGQTTLDRVQQLVLDAQQNGKPITQLKKDIMQVAGVNKRRAALIARDQIGKLNGQITKNRQTNLGIEKYQWITAGDKRVRPKHRALDGRVFSWQGTGQAPGGIMPGSEIQCRCVAVPVFEPEFFDDKLVPEPNIVLPVPVK